MTDFIKGYALYIGSLYIAVQVAIVVVHNMTGLPIGG